MIGSSTTRRLAVLSMLLVAGVASAQDSGGLKDPPVPRELFDGLLATFGRPQSTVVVGELPPALKARLFVPPGAKIVGGSYTTAQSYAVITMAARPESLSALYLREMAKSGWTYVPVVTPSMSAFRDPANAVGTTPPPVDGPNTYCNNGSAIVMRVDYQGLGVTRLLFSTYPTYPACQGGRTTVGGITVMPGTIIAQNGVPTVRPHPLPMLINPVGAPMQLGLCPSDNMSVGGPSTELATTMGVDQLFDHYGKQLADSGWKPLGALIMTRTWTRTDSAGNRSDATLTIRTFPEVPNCRRISADLKGRKR